ncbi:NrtA/SsuA/CpmA family ABC transporter substrate-binding protein [Kitasatospora sp. NPDC097643]|uniref:ABC transporter substrate-binding protein n=1 Tax=Kitasatospora sp. NPDC097643 TaxID=3157230 RepID=UPI003320359D
MPGPRAVVALLLAAVLTTLTTACSNPSAAAGDPTVTIAGSDYLGGAPVYLAEDRRLWSAEHVQAKLQAYGTGRDALNAVLGGQAQLGVVGDLPAVTAALTGRDLRIVADLSRFADWRILTRTDRGITGFEQLRGRRIGLPQGTNVEYALALMLASGGLAGTDVQVVNLAPNQIPAALARGDIDAGVTFPSFYDATRTTLGGRYAELRFTGYTARTLLVAGPTATDPTTTAVLRALLRAQTELTADPAAARRAVLAQSNGALQSGYVDAYQPVYAYRPTLSAELLQQLQDEAGWAEAAQGLPGPTDRAALLGRLHAGPLTAVDPAAVTVR